MTSVLSVPSDPSVPSVPSDDRPTASLSMASLLRLSIYWLGLVAVFGGIGVILQERAKVLIPDASVRYAFRMRPAIPGRVQGQSGGDFKKMGNKGYNRSF